MLASSFPEEKGVHDWTYTFEKRLLSSSFTMAEFAYRKRSEPCCCVKVFFFETKLSWSHKSGTPL